MITEITVPDIGDFKNIPIIEILVKAGDQVAKDAPLLVLESDKATLDVPSPRHGIVKELKVALGDRVSLGSTILMLETSGAEAASAARELTPGGAAPRASAASPPSPSPSPSSSSSSSSSPPPPAATVDAASWGPRLVTNLTDRAPNSVATSGPSRRSGGSPSVRRFARELGVDLAAVKGSGPRGRILKEDLQSHVKAAMKTAAEPAAARAGNQLASGHQQLAPWPQIDFSKFGPTERRPLTQIRKISGENLARNWALIPHVTNFEDADITELEAFRKQLNVEDQKASAKITLLSFLIKSTAVVLKRFPEFNSSLDGSELIIKRYCHIGFAADTPNGLVVPVIRDVDTKGITQIANEAAALAALARDGKLKLADMQGGCFTISSLGGIGGTGFTPIINAPEVAILGVTRAQIRPVWDGSVFQPRLILPLTLSWDHRVVDGAAAARFLNQLSLLLGDFRRALL